MIAFLKGQNACWRFVRIAHFSRSLYFCVRMPLLHLNDPHPRFVFELESPFVPLVVSVVLVTEGNLD